MRWVVNLLCVGVLAALLVGCNLDSSGDQDFGSEAPAKTRRFVAAMHDDPSSRAAVAALPPFYVNTEEVLDWAEWKYPALFPKGPETQELLYSGVYYWVRAYPNGN